MPCLLLAMPPKAVVEEVRRQFREIKGIMEGTAKPDYSRGSRYCVDQSGDQRDDNPRPYSRGPCLSRFGLLLERLPSAACLSADSHGSFVGISMTTGGAAWDNAKNLLKRTIRRQGQ